MTILTVTIHSCGNARLMCRLICSWDIERGSASLSYIGRRQIPLFLPRLEMQEDGIIYRFREE